MNISNKIQNAFLLILQPLLLNLVSIPATAYIIRSLGPVQYGQWAIAMTLIGTVTFLTNLGLRTLFVRSVAQEPETISSALAEQLGLRLLLGLLAASFALALCFCLRYPPVVLQCTAIASVGFLVKHIVNDGGDVLQGLQRFKEFAAVNFIVGLALTAASVVAIWRGADPVGLSVAYLVGPAISLVLLFTLIRRQNYTIGIRWNFHRYRELLQEVKMMAGHQFLFTLHNRVEQLLVPKLVGIAPLGYFSAGTLPADRLDMVPDGLVTAFFPALSRACKEGDDTATQEVSHLAILSLVTCLPLAILIAFLAGPIAELLFPKNADICREVIQITIWSVPMLGILGPMHSAMQACGKYSEAARIGIWAAVCNLVTSTLLISTLGLRGACISWTLRPALSALFILPAFIRSFPAVLLSVPFTRIASCLLVMAGLLWLVTQMEMTATTIGAGGLVAVVAYVSSLVALRVITAGQIKSLLQRKQVG